MKNAANWIKILFIIIYIIAGADGLTGENQDKQDTKSITDTICEIGKLENNRDPKCHATATRLENFMYGTKLSAKARFLKVDLQKKLLFHLWERVSKAVKSGGTQKALNERFRQETGNILKYTKDSNGDIIVRMPESAKYAKDAKDLIITKRDTDHYSSVAYGLRAILALQQDVMFRTDIDLVPLDPASIAFLKEFLDIFTLSVLQVGDREARLADEYEITPEIFQKAWETVQDSVSRQAFSASDFWNAPVKVKPVEGASKFPTLRQTMAQKIASYEAYNKISMKVFLRNLQVYFARHQWPSDVEEGNKFRNLFTRAMTTFAFESWQYAEAAAKKKGRPFIREADVDEMWQSFVPFDVNEYEDVIFFPRLGREGSLTIEAYDFDAFRDSGIHWRYLQFAMEDYPDRLSMEPDPFAAELMVEGIAQFGVLALRLAGMEAKEKGDKRLNTAHLERALKDIRDRIQRHAKAKPLTSSKDVLVSSANVTRLSAGKTYFTNVTQESGIRFMHRSSDWLSRMLRSYLKKSETVGTLNVPPAFGGSGAAAGDVNNDGFTDVLLLSGSGNALYFGDGGGGFRDVTREAGIVFKRKDGYFGEPRQPVIADFDNDGLQDILITYVQDDHRLYRNVGNGKFEDVSVGSGLGGAGLVGGPAAAFDYDKDGLLDVYIAYFGDYPRGHLPKLSRDNLNALPNKLFRNVGNMRFEDVTEKAGVGNTGWGQALAHTDFDSDGWQDIIVGNDFGVNVYYRNRGDGTFENVAPEFGTDKPSFTMNVGITDLNRDGFPDIYISNIVTMVKDEKYVLPAAEVTMRSDPAKMARMRVVEANDLFLSQVSDGRLETYKLSDAVGRGFSSTGWAWGANFFDFDNDGDDDLYCVNGMNEYSVYSDTPYYTKVFKEKREVRLKVYQKESNVFFVNEGGRLLNYSRESGTDLLGNSRSAVYVDFDNDGDLDVILNNYHGAAVVYENNSELLNNHWLKVRLVGDPQRKTNRDAIGARVIAYSGGKQLVWREIRGGDGYLNVNPKEQHMGLGKEGSVDLKVIWPNGEEDSFKGVKSNQKYVIHQGNKAIKRI